MFLSNEDTFVYQTDSHMQNAYKGFGSGATEIINYRKMFR